jgi:hypothetical protein
MGGLIESRLALRLSDSESVFGLTGIGTWLTGGGATWPPQGVAAA